MRLNKLCKQMLSVTLAAALAIGTPIAVGPQTVKAEGSTETTLPTPIYENDFEAEDAADGTKGKIIGDGKIEKADEKHGNVFHNAAGGRRQNYYKLPEDVFTKETNKFAENKGVTITFAVNKADATDFYFSPIFSAYDKAPVDGKNEQPIFMFIMQSRGLLQYNSEGGWCDFTGKENDDPATNENDEPVNHEGTQYLDDGQWHIVTAVLSDQKGYYYVDGKIVNQWTVKGDGATSNDGFLSQGIKKLTYICLGGNQAWAWEDNDPAYMFDDVKIYDKALTEAEIATMIPQVEKVEIKAEGSTAAGTEADPYVVKNIHYMSGKDKEWTGSKLAEINSAVKWSVSDDKVAAVDENGKVTLKDADKGTFTVTATTGTGDSKKATCTIKYDVEEQEVTAVEDIKIDAQTLYAGKDYAGKLISGKSVTINPVIEPSNATIKDVVLTLKDEADKDKISIDGYTITPKTAQTEGTVKVIATSVTNSKGSKPVSKEFDVNFAAYKFGEGTADKFTCAAWPKGGYSGWEELKGNFSIEYNFTNVGKSASADNFKNFGITITDGTKRARFRADAAINPEDPAEGEGNVIMVPLLEKQGTSWDATKSEPVHAVNDGAWTNTVTDWATWLADMKKGMQVKATITRDGQDLTVSYYFNAASGNEYFTTAKTTLLSDVKDTLYVSLSGEECECSNIKLTPANQSVELGIGGSKDYDVTDIVPGDKGIKEIKPSDEKVATAVPSADGKTVTVTGVKVGTATVTVTTEDDLTFEIKVNVSDDSVTPAPTPSQDPGTASGPAVSSGPAVTPTEPTQAPTTTDTPGSSDTPGTTPSEPTPTPGNNDDNTGNTGDDEKNEPQATTATVNKSGAKTTVKTTENGTAAIKKVKSSKKSVTVSSTVKVDGVEYKVTTIEANAFANCKKATKITLPSTVKTIKKKAFTGAKKVKTIVVKSKKAVTVKKGAFKGVDTKKVTIKASKMSKKQLKKFKKTLKKAGFKGKVKK